jgi:hypothetical protein
MKTFIHIIKSGGLLLASLAVLTACKKELSTSETTVDYYQLNDQMARPAINTVFITAPDKDLFNSTIPSIQSAAFKTKMQNRLLALNPGYTTNLLGLNADAFSNVVATDVLNVSLTKKTTFFDGTNVLTGRALNDDVIDVELTLIFGGPNGTSNPTLTSDHVNKNDKPFSSTMPYMASPW